MFRTSTDSRWQRACWLMAAKAVALGLLLSLHGAAPLRAAKLERELLKQAPTVIRYFQGKSCKNVGVLKFRVKKGTEQSSDNVGTFNTTLANRLQVALVLANDVSNTQKQLGIIDRASAVAARIKGASHLTTEGLEKLFQQRYPLAWGDQDVLPDAFVSGLVQFNSDLREAKVKINAYCKDAKPEKITEFTVDTDPNTLLETGESFLLRGVFDTPTAIQEAEKVKNNKEEYPLQQPAAPIALEIYYNGQRAPVEIENGKARVREPRQGEKVSFVLKRNNRLANRYAMVLMVNGENTLYKERLPAVQCRKWVLDAGDPPTTVQGYQVSANKLERFRILSSADSKRKGMHYGADVGTISLAVFRELKSKPAPEPASDDADDLRAISRGVLPAARPRNLAALKAQLWNEATRGLIAGGEQVEGSTRRVAFDPDPTPVMSVTISYYQP